MTKRNRKTLADNFADGKRPTEEAFSDLIDSMVNIVDDGFDKTAEDGMRVAQLDGNSKLVSFFDEITVKQPLWSISFSMSGYGDGKNLSFYPRNDSAASLTLAGIEADPEQGTPAKIRVGINKDKPEHALDVCGVIASEGRIGREGRREFQVRADGKWHPVITGLDGCQAFEVMAGVGRKRSGKYALMHAFAVSTFNSKKSGITYHQAHYASRCDQIDLRWTGDMHNYSLEMRTRCSYEENVAEAVYIRYYLTRLWFDPFMEGSVQDGNGDAASKGS